MINDELARDFLTAQKTGKPYFNAPLYTFSLELQKENITVTTIPVEKSQAAFLLIGNPSDGVWPSDVLSGYTIERLKQANHPDKFQLPSYEDGGPMLITFPYHPTTLRQFYLPTLQVWEVLGGTAEGAARAAGDSWPKMIRFLLETLEVN